MDFYQISQDKEKAAYVSSSKVVPSGTTKLQEVLTFRGYCLSGISVVTERLLAREAVLIYVLVTRGDPGLLPNVDGATVVADLDLGEDPDGDHLESGQVGGVTGQEDLGVGLLADLAGIGAVPFGADVLDHGTAPGVSVGRLRTGVVVGVEGRHERAARRVKREVCTVRDELAVVTGDDAGTRSRVGVLQVLDGAGDPGEAYYVDRVGGLRVGQLLDGGIAATETLELALVAEEAGGRGRGPGRGRLGVFVPVVVRDGDEADEQADHGEQGQAGPRRLTVAVVVHPAHGAFLPKGTDSLCGLHETGFAA